MRWYSNSTTLSKCIRIFSVDLRELNGKSQKWQKCVQSVPDSVDGVYRRIWTLLLSTKKTASLRKNTSLWTSENKYIN